MLAIRDDVDLWSEDECHFQRHGSRCRMWIPPEDKDPVLRHAPTRDHPDIPIHAGDTLLVYPNPAKDVETLEYPYAELFRDFAAATCRPNSVVVTYGYGFGDSHINRMMQDMLSIPSTHLVVISYDHADGRLKRFYADAAREAQITLMVGPHFGDLCTLVDNYLPKPAIDRNTWRMVELLGRRGALERRTTAPDLDQPAEQSP